ncbi:MAG TPA: hypothetical protein VN758_04340 [Solirubrobacterales bacterium]|nr:hypothetical protein [Solirubrobacterales bacterium]
MEDRVVWRGSDALRAVAEVVKWPFERAAWAIERGLVWPLEERTGDWSGALRAAGVAVMALLAVGAGIFGLLWASGSGGGSAPQTQQTSVPVVAPVVSAAASKEALAQAAPVLKGATPDFTPKASSTADTSSGSAAKESSEAPETAAAATTETETANSPSAGTAAAASKVVPAGPAATKVGRQFAGAFVLYETGRSDAKVRTSFAATATPELARSLLRRPPRLPANVKVPQAKVLNLVPGPQHGDTYTLSVSLLRVGVTSELRIDMQRDKKTGEWRVTDVLG